MTLRLAARQPASSLKVGERLQDPLFNVESGSVPAVRHLDLTYPVHSFSCASNQLWNRPAPFTRCEPHPAMRRCDTPLIPESSWADAAECEAVWRWPTRIETAREASGDPRASGPQRTTTRWGLASAGRRRHRSAVRLSEPGFAISSVNPTTFGIKCRERAMIALPARGTP